MTRHSAPFAAAALVALASCTGYVEKDGADPVPPAGTTPTPRGQDPAPGVQPTPDPGTGQPAPTAPPAAPAPAPTPAACATSKAIGDTPLRRLTRSQYANTVRDLFGAALPPGAALEAAARFPVDDRAGPFLSNSVSSVADAHARLYLDAAESLADAATRPETIKGLIPCAATAPGEPCAKQLIATFGRRAFRRPVPADAASTLASIYTLGAQGGGFAGGARLVVQAMLIAPEFLYHVEAAPRAGAALSPLDGYEIASRLSYFLWDSMPDDALLTAAEKGELTTPEGVRRHAERLIADARARDAIARFAADLLGIDTVETITRDAKAYPAFTAELPAAMKAETLELTDQILRRGDGLLRTWLTASYSFPSDPLFKVYGVSKPFGYAGKTPLELPKDQRAGVLTHPSVLAATAHADHTSPVKRGMFVLTNVLCHEIPLPEGLEIPQLPDPDPTKTTRERFVQHTAEPACAACHKIIDPIGFAFERYDPVGSYRAREGTKSIDDTGIIAVGDPALDGPVAGAVALAAKLAASEKVGACMTRQVQRFALGRLDGAADACTTMRLHDRFRRSGNNLRALMLEMTTDDAFRMRPATP